MSNLSSLQANVSIVKDKYIARLQQRMPMAIQALAATIATRASSSSSEEHASAVPRADGATTGTAAAAT